MATPGSRWTACGCRRCREARTGAAAAGCRRATTRASVSGSIAAGDTKGSTHRIWHSRELDTFSNSLYSSAGFRHGHHAGTGFLDSSPASIAITGTFAITYVRSPYTHALGIAL